MRNYSALQSLVCIVATAVAIASPAIAADRSAPPLEKAFTSFGQCSAQDAPTLPPAWQATGLLTPFGKDELSEASVSVDTTAKAMRVTVRGTKTGEIQDTLVVGDRSYRLLKDGKGGLRCAPLANTGWQAPGRDLFQQRGCSCQGSSKFNGHEGDAWRCPTIDGKSNEFNWVWFSRDATRQPMRLIFSRLYASQIERQKHVSQSKKQQELDRLPALMRLPVLSEAAMVHLPEYSQARPGALNELVELCENPAKPQLSSNQAQTVPKTGWIDANACPAPGSSEFPPKWPATAFFNGSLFAIDGGYTSMAVYYDYPRLREASMIKSQRKDARAQGFAYGKITEDRLNTSQTITVVRPAISDGTFPPDLAYCPANSTLENVGIWHRHWPNRDGCKCNGVIKPNTALNRTDKTMWAMSCHFGRQPANTFIKAWYSMAGAPQMFYQTNAGDLDLIDYYNWLPDVNYAKKDPIFAYPTRQCALAGDAPKNQQPGMDCTKCHGGAEPK